jgi:S-DNA-T family DNA segregation ATPase FtsK/SpoIIIE
MRRAGFAQVPVIRRLPEVIDGLSMPAQVNGQPVLGVWDQSLEPIGFDPVGCFLVTGPPQSGKSATVSWLLQSMERAQCGGQYVLFGTRRSNLVGAAPWMNLAVTPDEMEALAYDLAGRIANDDSSVSRLVVVIESIGDLLSTAADMPLQDLMKAVRTADGFVIAEGETSTVGSSWPLLQAARSSRTGMALQPEQLDGDSLFKTPFPRLSRAEFPVGRGLFARGGRAVRVQVPIVET